MKPKPIDDITAAFPVDVYHLMPPEKEIPEKYWRIVDDSWPGKLFTALFFNGLVNLKLIPREGVDAQAAFRHIRAIMGSFQPKHEYKEAACRYLFDHWFVSATWEERK